MDDLEAFDVDIEGFDLITIARLYDSALRRIGLRKDGRAAVHQADATNTSTSTAGQEKGAKFPTSKAHISVVFHSFRLIFGRVIIFRNNLEA